MALGLCQTMRIKKMFAALSAAGLASLSGLPAQANDWRVVPRLNVSETYTDNVTLSETNKRSDFVTAITPGVTLEREGARLRARVDYSFQALLHSNNQSSNNSFHQLNANATAELLADHLFVDGRAIVAQQNLSLLGTQSVDNINTTGNRASTRSFYLSPYYRTTFGNLAAFEARYAADYVSVNTGGLGNSKSNQVDLILKSGPHYNRSAWNVTYRQQKIDYSERINETKFQSLIGSGRYQFMPRWSVLGSVGYENNSYSSTQTDTKGPLWSAGFGWNPSIRTSLEATVGHRYFGPTRSFLFDHRTRATRWHVGYSQDITTSRNQLTLPGGSTLTYVENLISSRTPGLTPLQLRQSALQFIQLFNLPQILPQTTTLSNAVFLQKQLDARVSVDYSKSLFLITAVRTIIDSLNTGTSSNAILGLNDFAFSQHIKTTSGTAGWYWRFAPRTSSEVTVGLTRSELPDIDRRDDLTYFRVGATHQFLPKVFGGVDLAHNERKSNQPGADYKENRLVVRLNMTF